MAGSENKDLVSFVVGELFDSFLALDSKMKDYGESRSVQMTRRDSFLLESAKKRAPKKIEAANRELKYYYLKYTCSFGGKPYRSEGKGVRPRQSTFKRDCPACIKFSLSDNGQHLAVTSIFEEHNHQIMKEVFQHLPSQRQLTTSEKAEAQELLALKANKKFVQQHLSKSTGKIITLKDLSNVKGPKQQVNLEEIILRLKSIERSVVEIFRRSENEFTGLFFQDSTMQVCFSAFPEVLLFDATYKLNDRRMPVYIFLSIDKDELN